jgi:pimeloyl-ACP methyl ester carboxylesterase
MQERVIETRKGIRVRVREAGSGPPLVFMHGIAGLLDEEPLLDRLAEHFRVLAPVWPGYGEEEGEEKLEDMLDFSLHGLDVLEALDVQRPHLVGHSLGGMIAAEMASLIGAGAGSAIGRLVLLAPFGLWHDDAPIADLFAVTPFDLPKRLFADAERGQKALTAGLDFSHDGALTDFMVGNARRLGTAGKILFPIPNRRLAKRLYRVASETLIVWGSADRLIPPVYASHWQAHLPHAQCAEIEGAAHMLTVEQPAAVAEMIDKFLRSAG